MRFVLPWRSAPVLGALVIASLALAQPAVAGERAAAMVIDANNGRVLHDKAGSELRYPASLTKMMTLYLAFEAIEAGRLQFSSPVEVSERAAAAAPSKIGLDAGETISLRDAIKALIVKSANDMAVAVAEKISGSEAEFAKLMTKRARQIGMRDTTFRNASGLPDPSQTTTARDMLTLAMRLQDDFPQHYRLFSTRVFSHKGKTYRTHNALLGRFAGVDGIKTGYTRASGFNLVSSYRASGKHVVAAVFGGVSAGLRDAHMRMLLARAIETASTERTRKAGPQLIAEAKPAKRPATKAVAKPKPRIEAAPVAVAEPTPSVSQEPAAGEQVSQAADTQQRPKPVIAMAKVKTVSVLARDPTAQSEDGEAVASIEPAASQTATPAEEGTVAAPPMTLASSMPRVDFLALKAGLAERAVAETAKPAPVPALFDAPPLEGPALMSNGRLDSRAAAPGRPPSTLEAQMALLSDHPNHLGGPPADAEKPALQTAIAGLVAPMPVPVAQGVMRSPGPAPASDPAPAEPAVVRKPDAGYHVQIGVYGSQTDAQRAMAAVRNKAGNVLADRAPIAIPLTKGDQKLFRARFAGFDSASATNACDELRRSGVDCFVARAN